MAGRSAFLFNDGASLTDFSPATHAYRMLLIFRVADMLVWDYVRRWMGGLLGMGVHRLSSNNLVQFQSIFSVALCSSMRMDTFDEVKGWG